MNRLIICCLRVHALSTAKFLDNVCFLLAPGVANPCLAVTVDASGRLSDIKNKQSGVTTAVTNDLFQYLPSVGPQASGAYVFNPAEDGQGAVRYLPIDIHSSNMRINPKHFTNPMNRSGAPLCKICPIAIINSLRLFPVAWCLWC